MKYLLNGTAQLLARNSSLWLPMFWLESGGFRRGHLDIGHINTFSPPLLTNFPALPSFPTPLRLQSGGHCTHCGAAVMLTRAVPLFL